MIFFNKTALTVLNKFYIDELSALTFVFLHTTDVPTDSNFLPFPISNQTLHLLGITPKRVTGSYLN